MSNNTQVKTERQANYDIDPIYLNRWSPRSYQEKDVPEDVLYSVFEAARWAPSASNEQPWRFIIARTKEEREKFYPFIMDGNRIWCEKAPVLAVLVSNTVTSKGQPNGSNEFDAGAAWGYLALEAARQGLAAHCMAGFFEDKARDILEVPEEFAIYAVISLGYRGDKEELSETLQEREVPSSRRPLKETLFEGGFGENAIK
ncbi:nitroreductase [Scopulibacillus darangshiensis]|uniref:Nitroreductase n=1 Tax=Scopulibacillus darangshiensis TaxID=442528 RepID=A0A4V2SKU0_9BACL|nr:nitroreductase family protein [Scopulibacillus darangshiensis]TCP20856.1 nitroreductase [Scopulibacillus darangshiensis]